MTDFYMIEFLLKGFLIGLAIAAPVGPVGLLCIKTSLTYGRKAGLATGAGAAFADTFWAAAGAFSLLFVMEWLETHSWEIRFFGGILLVLIGIMIVMKPPPKKEHDIAEKINANLWKDFVLTFFVTLSNPATIISFLAVFAGFGIHTDGDFTKALPLIFGVLCGSLFWWYSLSFSVSLFRVKVNDETIHKINILSGFIIGLFGLAALVSVFSVFPEIF
jgi:threonine/homoserine/homoserine lactone efflux protein